MSSPDNSQPWLTTLPTVSISPDRPPAIPMTHAMHMLNDPKSLLDPQRSVEAFTIGYFILGTDQVSYSPWARPIDPVYVAEKIGQAILTPPDITARPGLAIALGDFPYFPNPFKFYRVDRTHHVVLIDGHQRYEILKGLPDTCDTPREWGYQVLHQDFLSAPRSLIQSIMISRNAEHQSLPNNLVLELNHVVQLSSTCIGRTAYTSNVKSICGGIGSVKFGSNSTTKQAIQNIAFDKDMVIALVETKLTSEWNSVWFDQHGSVGTLTFLHRLYQIRLPALAARIIRTAAAQLGALKYILQRDFVLEDILMPTRSMNLDVEQIGLNADETQPAGTFLNISHEQVVEIITQSAEYYSVGRFLYLPQAVDSKKRLSMNGYLESYKAVFRGLLLLKKGFESLSRWQNRQSSTVLADGWAELADCMISDAEKKEWVENMLNFLTPSRVAQLELAYRRDVERPFIKMHGGDMTLNKAKNLIFRAELFDALAALVRSQPLWYEAAVVAGMKPGNRIGAGRFTPCFPDDPSSVHRTGKQMGMTTNQGMSSDHGAPQYGVGEGEDGGYMEELNNDAASETALPQVFDAHQWLPLVDQDILAHSGEAGAETTSESFYDGQGSVGIDLSTNTGMYGYSGTAAHGDWGDFIEGGGYFQDVLAFPPPQRGFSAEPEYIRQGGWS